MRTETRDLVQAVRPTVRETARPHRLRPGCAESKSWIKIELGVGAGLVQIFM